MIDKKKKYATKYDVSIKVIEILLKNQLQRSLLMMRLLQKNGIKEFRKNYGLREKEFFRLLHERRKSNLKGIALN